MLTPGYVLCEGVARRTSDHRSASKAQGDWWSEYSTFLPSVNQDTIDDRVFTTRENHNRDSDARWPRYIKSIYHLIPTITTYSQYFLGPVQTLKMKKKRKKNDSHPLFKKNWVADGDVAQW